jgi:acyl-CoA synthetase (AMP-forming)/AMP-acid ligase II
MWLWESLRAGGAPALHTASATIRIADLRDSSLLGPRLESLSDRCVLLAVCDPLAAALALIELDGVARRLVLCPPDLSARHLSAVIETAGADVWLGDENSPKVGPELDARVDSVLVATELRAGHSQRRQIHETEWILLSSGTTGMPKLVIHTLQSLCAAIPPSRRLDVQMSWSTFYDIRRYGGLQILLRALHAGALVLPSAGEPVTQFLRRAGAARVTHISGTASHWRSALMSGAAACIEPHYVRLSGEIADQAILDSLHLAYPRASIVHAFASTEAGVAFEVEDGHAGFPAAVLDGIGVAAGVQIRIVDETLRIRSPGNAKGYLGSSAALTDAEGFVDTGDRVQLRDGRYRFRGRAGGVINVGGFKVHPEEIEAIINSHPGVRLSRVSARRNPITGAVVIAEIVPHDSNDALPDDVLTESVMELCRGVLPPYKVPALVRIVARLEVSAAGKLLRGVPEHG